MGITTKGGDGGKTGLYMGSRVSKDSFRIEFGGVLDELGSFIGMAMSFIRQKKIKRDLEKIREHLFIIGTEVATEGPFLGRLKKRLTARDVVLLEEKIGELEKKLKLKTRCFSTADEGTLSSVLNVARTIARKAERRAVTMTRKKVLKNKEIIVYLNRLSDLLFLMSICCAKSQHG
ncbi:MAG: cob(I)yrinic acid a,c-diamide adenosyltransferase [Candidatus Omnitrophota bacterium]